MGNILEGSGYLDATHQDMGKFDSLLEVGYKRVADVIQGFVVHCTGEDDIKEI